MSGYRVQDVKHTNRLREAYGEEIVLTEDGRESPVSHNIVMEFDVGGRSYAVLQPNGEASGDEEYSVFRVRDLGNGEYEIETIEDDDEWEDISELVDEMTTRFSDET